MKVSFSLSDIKIRFLRVGRHCHLRSGWLVGKELTKSIENIKLNDKIFYPCNPFCLLFLYNERLLLITRSSMTNTAFQNTVKKVIIDYAEYTVLKDLFYNDQIHH